jgi:putative intracellular protease/amidase
VTGLYDLSTPAYSGRYALDRAGVPADRLTAVQLPGGHSVYKDKANRRALADAVRRFVTAAR